MPAPSPDTVRRIARQHAQTALLMGVDFLPVVIRYATRRANQRGLHNVRFAVKDAQGFMAAYVAASSLAEVHLYHPQPYHDPRRAHLRLITPRFLADVHRGLGPEGRIFVQTDNPDYWAYLARVLPVFFAFEEHEGPWPDAPEGRSRREILATLVRLYHREADYDGSWWGIRPDSTGPYYDPREWECSVRIASEIGRAHV